MSGASGSRRGYRRLLSRQSSSAEKIEGEPNTSTSMSKSKSTKQAAHASKEVKAHPLLKMIDAKDLEKAAAKPEFLRYLEYMKEGGSWDPALDRPVLHFK